MHFFDRSLWFASVLSVCTLWGGGAVAQTAPAAAEQELQRELLLRMVGTESEVFLGQLPPELAIDLPLPDQARIVGSVTSSRNGLGSSLIFLDVPRSPQQVRNFYQEQLSRAGWNELGTPSPPGFASTEDEFPFSMPPTFCKDEQELTVSVKTLSNQTATVILQLSNTANEPYSLCVQPEFIELPDASVPLSVLTAPPNTQVRDMGSKFLGYDWNWIADIESPLTNQALVAHYVSQLEQAGWTQQASDTSGAIAWSFLTLQDDEGQSWQGFLSIAPAAEPNTYAASIVVFNPNLGPTPF